MSEGTGVAMDTRARDALAVLSYTYLQFDRPGDAATLLDALARVDRDPSWAASARCLALLMAGRADDAAQAARSLLETDLDDTRRCHVLRILARACWNLGLAEEARAHQAAVRDLLAATVLRRTAPPNR